MTRRLMAALIRGAVAQLSPDTEAAQITLGNMPQVRAEHAFQLLAQWSGDADADRGAEATAVDRAQVLLGIDADDARPGLTTAAALAKEPAQPDGKLVRGLGQVRLTLDAVVELRPVPE
jgi:hypothetical protein